MSNEQITFSCASCGVELKVPLSFAGVTGPCPGCQASITAPAPSSEDKKPAPSAPSAPKAPASSPPVPQASAATPPAPASITRPAPTAPTSPAKSQRTLVPSSSPAPSPEPSSAPPRKISAQETPSPIKANSEAPKPTRTVPDISVPSTSKPKDAPTPTTAFPSSPAPASKTVLPPRRGELEAAPTSAKKPGNTPTANPAPAFPSSLIPNASAPASPSPATHDRNTAPPSAPLVADSLNVPRVTGNISSPTASSPQDLKPNALPGEPASSPPTPSIPQPEPKSGLASYPIPQSVSGVSAVPQPNQPLSGSITTPINPSSAPAPADLPAVTAPPAPSSSPTTPAATPSAPSTPSAAPRPESSPPPVVSGSLSTFAPTPQPEAPAAKKERPKKSKLRWLWLAIPLLFLLLCGAVVYLVSDLLNNHTAQNRNDSGDLHVLKAPNQSARQEAKEKMAHLDPAQPSLGFSKIPNRLDPVSADLSAIDRRDLFVEGEAPPSSRLEATTPAPTSKFNPEAPNEVLHRFLHATSLAQRQHLLSPSKRSPEELASSSLARALPEVLHSRLLHYMVNDAERHTEHFFEVSFQKTQGVRAYPILIQVNDWGDGKYQIHTDAFLDLFDDALSAFATKPVAGTKTFHVVADAYKHCFDEIIPDWDKKSFLKLRNHPSMPPRLIAYFNRSSPLADEISAPKALPWGESGICTISVAWNTDDPERPFVELLDVIGFTWEP